MRKRSITKREKIRRKRENVEAIIQWVDKTSGRGIKVCGSVLARVPDRDAEGQATLRLQRTKEMTNVQRTFRSLTVHAIFFLHLSYEENVQLFYYSNNTLSLHLIYEGNAGRSKVFQIVCC